MATYAIGDLQGCFQPLQRLLDKLKFDPAVDTLWFAGDLVNRGKHSLETLRFVRSLGTSAVTVLGNHDISLIAAFHGLRKPHKSLHALVDAPDYAELVNWLAHRNLLHVDTQLGYAMSHAGISPAWDLETAQNCANSIQNALRQPNPSTWLKQMYGDQPNYWSHIHTEIEQQRYAMNAFTRMRYCYLDGGLEFEYKESPLEVLKSNKPTQLIPWFMYPRKQALGIKVVFGHWSTLGYYQSHNVIALDTGCVWGRALSAIRLDIKNQTAITQACDDYG